MAPRMIPVLEPFMEKRFRKPTEVLNVEKGVIGDNFL